MEKLNLTLKASLSPNNPYLQKLLDALFLELTNELSGYQNKSKRIDTPYQVWDYSEITMVTYLTHALRRMDPEYQRFIFKQEVGLENESRQAQGRADLLIQDLDNNTAIIVETKKHFSRPSEPTTKHWEKEASEAYYGKVMNQCERYYNSEKSQFSDFKLSINE